MAGVDEWIYTEESSSIGSVDEEPVHPLTTQIVDFSGPYASGEAD